MTGTAQRDELHDYWCPRCQTWQLFQFEDRGRCDECAMAEVDFSQSTSTALFMEDITMMTPEYTQDEKEELATKIVSAMLGSEQPPARPCLLTYTLSDGSVVTPKIINSLASNSTAFSAWLVKHPGLSALEIYTLAYAIYDNWERFWESC